MSAQLAFLPDWQEQHTSIRTHEDVVNLAVSLARPVVRSMLPLAHAEASIAAAVGRAFRLGLIASPDGPDGVIGVANHILHQNIKSQEDRRSAAVAAIALQVRPLIEQHAAIGRIRAEAHDVNADGGMMLTEDDVESAVVHALYVARAKLQRTKPKPRPRPGR
jgi:hypothetical protein